MNNGTIRTRHLSVYVLICTLALIVAGCSESRSASKSIPTYEKSSTSVINVDDLSEVVAYGDYVFAGRVDKYIDTVYEDIVEIETPDGMKSIGDPYTNYKVTVLENIKGELITDSEIQVQKSGGINEDESAVVIFEGDTLLEEGKCYIFVVYTQPDGKTLLAAGKNSTIEIEESVARQLAAALKIKDENKQETKIEDSLEKSNVFADVEDALEKNADVPASEVYDNVFSEEPPE